MNNWNKIDIPSHPVKDGSWVKVIAHIRNNSTGEVREYLTNEILHDEEEHPSVFNWEENNYSCDCNRSLFFEYALMPCGGDGEDAMDKAEAMGAGRCGEGGFSVNLENPVDGEIYYREFH